MKKLSAACRNFEEIIAGTGLIITILAVAFNVVMRYFFSRSQNWAEEIASMGFAWVVFVGAAAVYKRKMHIGIDVFVNLLPVSLRTSLQWGMTAFFVVLNAYLTYLSAVFSLSAWTKPTHILLIPYTFVDLSATVGFALMTIHAVSDFAALLKSPGTREGV
jgi:TRAP-type C4-dicarboxylate transport system permease small subunit